MGLPCVPSFGERDHRSVALHSMAAEGMERDFLVGRGGCDRLVYFGGGRRAWKECHPHNPFAIAFAIAFANALANASWVREFASLDFDLGSG